MEKIIGLLIFSLMSVSVNATLLTGEVDGDAYVTFEGYDLAWASPCSDGLLEGSCAAIDLSEQSGYGWNVMTSDLFSSLGLSAATFIVDYSSSNTESYSGNNYAKATGWFSSSYSHIDVSDGTSGLWSFADVVDASSTYETIVYRTSDIASVPEPASVILLALGLVSIGFSRKKKSV